jgi:hypothetical protein
MAKQYLWSTGETTQTISVNPTEPTVYTLTVTDENGDTATNKILVSPSVKPSFTPVAKITCDSKICFLGETIKLSGCDSYCQGSQIVAYEWSTGETVEEIEISPQEPTVYTLTVTAMNGLKASTSILINVEIGEINLMHHLPMYWHDNEEMKQIQEKTLNYKLYDLVIKSDVIVSESFIKSASTSRLSEWERDLYIEQNNDRINQILSFFRKQGKLNEEKIKNLVKLHYDCDCDVRIKNSNIDVLIYPKNESDINYSLIEIDLYNKKPAHLGVKCDRYWYTWGELKEDSETWDLDFETWQKVKIYLPYLRG